MTYVTPKLTLVGSFENTTLNTGSAITALDATFAVGSPFDSLTFS